MPYTAKWSEQSEVEILKGNFRRSVSGLKGSVNKIRLVHPSETPVHHHAEEEQTVLMLSGEMDVMRQRDLPALGADQVCVIPAGVPHCFRSIAGEAVFLEAFSPGRIQNLVGFLGKMFLEGIHDRDRQEHHHRDRDMGSNNAIVCTREASC